MTSRPLSTDDVHVWRIPLDVPPATLDRLASLVSGDERDRADRFYFDRDRNRFLAARGALRMILGSYLDSDPSLLSFHYGPRGKPSLAGSPLEFNLTHSAGLALCAVALGRRLGIDVEALRPLPDAAAIAERFFSDAERRALRSVTEAQRTLAFFQCWTRKEAYIKAIGEGLSMPLDRFDVSLLPGEPARLLAVAGDPDAPRRWTLHDLDPGPGLVAAIAVEGPCSRPSCFPF